MDRLILLATAAIAMALYVYVLTWAARSTLSGPNKLLVQAIATLIIVVLMGYAPRA